MGKKVNPYQNVRDSVKNWILKRWCKYCEGNDCLECQLTPTKYKAKEG